MASVETVEIFDCTPDQLFSIITDYENYGDFISEIDYCEIIEDEGDRKLVEYNINMVKTFTYRLWMEKTDDYKVEWSLESGDLFKVSNGSWELEADGDQTKATYSVEAQFKMFIPGPIAKKAMNVNLPNMMRSYRERIEELYS